MAQQWHPREIIIDLNITEKMEYAMPRIKVHVMKKMLRLHEAAGA